MLDLPNIEETVQRAVQSTLKSRSRIVVKSATDSLGEDALSITIVVNDAGEITGDDALDTIVKIGQELRRKGENRIAITSFATESEMSAYGDSEL